MDDDELKMLMMIRSAKQVPHMFTTGEIENLPTISSSQFEDLKIECVESFRKNGVEYDGLRVWLSRMRVEDGEPFNEMITIEYLKDGHWTIHERHPGNPKDWKAWSKVDPNTLCWISR